MHHCVGGYVEKIVEGNEYICFIHKTNNINKPYITYEVFNNGNIGQYYLAYDRHITTDEDQRFKKQFQKHLKQMCHK